MAVQPAESEPKARKIGMVASVLLFGVPVLIVIGAVATGNSRNVGISAAGCWIALVLSAISAWDVYAGIIDKPRLEPFVRWHYFRRIWDWDLLPYAVLVMGILFGHFGWH